MKIEQMITLLEKTYADDEWPDASYNPKLDEPTDDYFEKDHGKELDWEAFKNKVIEAKAKADKGRKLTPAEIEKARKDYEEIKNIVENPKGFSFDNYLKNEHNHNVSKAKLYSKEDFNFTDDMLKNLEAEYKEISPFLKNKLDFESFAKYYAEKKYNDANHNFNDKQLKALHIKFNNIRAMQSRNVKSLEDFIKYKKLNLSAKYKKFLNPNYQFSQDEINKLKKRYDKEASKKIKGKMPSFEEFLKSREKETNDIERRVANSQYNRFIKHQEDDMDKLFKQDNKLKDKNTYTPYKTKGNKDLEDKILKSLSDFKKKVVKYFEAVSGIGVRSDEDLENSIATPKEYAQVKANLIISLQELSNLEKVRSVGKSENNIADNLLGYIKNINYSDLDFKTQKPITIQGKEWGEPRYNADICKKLLAYIGQFKDKAPDSLSSMIDDINDDLITQPNTLSDEDIKKYKTRKAILKHINKTIDNKAEEYEKLSPSEKMKYETKVSADGKIEKVDGLDNYLSAINNQLDDLIKKQKDLEKQNRNNSSAGLKHRLETKISDCEANLSKLKGVENKEILETYYANMLKILKNMLKEYEDSPKDTAVANSFAKEMFDYQKKSVEDAKRSLEKTKSGEYSGDIKAAEERVAAAEESLKKAENKLNTLKDKIAADIDVDDGTIQNKRAVMDTSNLRNSTLNIYNVSAKKTLQPILNTQFDNNGNKIKILGTLENGGNGPVYIAIPKEFIEDVEKLSKNQAAVKEFGDSKYKNVIKFLDNAKKDGTYKHGDYYVFTTERKSINGLASNDIFKKYFEKLNGLSTAKSDKFVSEIMSTIQNAFINKLNEESYFNY